MKRRAVEYFRECDGYWRAVVTEADGTRRNYARYNCKTKREAVEDVREARERYAIAKAEGVTR